MISRKTDVAGRAFSEVAVFPRDCIEIMRCRPFTFTHKLANKWFPGKTVLIGDAAHVYPPLGGQGIASGIHDAHQLAWRIALLEYLPTATDKTVQSVLSDWATEWTLSIQNSTALTKANGSLCNKDNVVMFRALQMFEWAPRSILGGETVDPQTAAECKGMSDIIGLFSKTHGGGKRLPQIYVETLFGRKVLSDCIFGPKDSPLRSLVSVTSTETPKFELQSLRTMLAESNIPPGLLSPDSIAVLSREPCRPGSVGIYSSNVRKASPTPLGQLSSKQARLEYDVEAFEQGLGANIRYAIVWSDFFTFAVAKDEKELELCLSELNPRLV